MSLQSGVMVFVPTCMVGTYGDCRLCIGKDGVLWKMNNNWSNIRDAFK